MVSSDEGSEDGAQEGMLEGIIRHHAEQHFNEALKSKDGLYGHFSLMLRDVSSEYKNQNMIVRNVNNFLVDRFIYYRRHREMEKEEAIHAAYCDSYEYIIQLKNDFPRISPVMRDNFRD